MALVIVLVLSQGLSIEVEAFRLVQVRRRQMKSSELLPGFEAVRLPGERLAQVTKTREENGIPITQSLRSALAELAKQLDVNPL